MKSEPEPQATDEADQPDREMIHDAIVKLRTHDPVGYCQAIARLIRDADD